jgi:hypothetical protein
VLVLLLLLVLLLIAVAAPVLGTDSRGLTARGPGPRTFPTLP